MQATHLLVVGIAVTFLLNDAIAHDTRSLAHRSVTLSEDMTLNGIARLNPPNERTRSILVNSNKWPYRVLRACFYEGGTEIRERIVHAARTWLLEPGVGLKVDFDEAPFRTCSDAPDAQGRFEDIRIGFRDEGYWSYIGIDSHHPSVVGATMNLQSFDVSPPAEPEFSRIVKHEFGHAFGFHHEHQSPDANCEREFDLDKIRHEFGWSNDDIKTNILVLQRNSKMYTWSLYDPKSIMMYALDERLFKPDAERRCYVPQNDELSAQDRRAMRSAYPSVMAPSSLSRSADGIGTMRLPDSIKSRLELQRALGGAAR